MSTHTTDPVDALPGDVICSPEGFPESEWQRRPATPLPVTWTGDGRAHVGLPAVDVG